MVTKYYAFSSGEIEEMLMINLPKKTSLHQATILSINRSTNIVEFLLPDGQTIIKTKLKTTNGINLCHKLFNLDIIQGRRVK